NALFVLYVEEHFHDTISFYSAPAMPITSDSCIASQLAADR
ncbi:MAG: hypothetical protein ACI8UP_004151, partial [Porticoccaceae bacterium]